MGRCGYGQRQPLLTFVVVGAGFAGVETLGGIHDFVREAIRFYPNLTPELVRTILISSEEFILPELGSKLGAYAQRKLAARGVEIITRTRVTAVRDSIIEISDGRTIPSTTLIWAAGNAPNPLVAALPIPKSGGRILVNEYLAVNEVPGVWALGDCASIPDHKTGGFYPPTAQHAIREARCAARNVAAEIVGGKKKPFGFSTLGQLAAIGRRTGVANVFGLNFSGFLAWWLWRTIYLSKLPGFDKNVRVAFDWTLDLLFRTQEMCDSSVEAMPWKSAVSSSPTITAVSSSPTITRVLRDRCWSSSASSIWPSAVSTKSSDSASCGLGGGC